MKLRSIQILGLASVALLSGCASVPLGPTVQVMPAANKPFQVFEQDQMECKQYAQSQVQGQSQAANQRAVGTAVVGTALGAAVGALMGGGRGAGVGAGLGGVVGSGVGASGSQSTQYSIQMQYDNAYSQCMYAHGNQVMGYSTPTP